MSSHNVPRPIHPRTKEQREQELQKIQQYKDLEQNIRQRTINEQYDETTFQLSSKLLRINPEHYTIWNVRRRCLRSSILSAFYQYDQQRDDTSETEGDNQTADVTDDQGSRHDDEETIRSELMFTIPLLIEFPKCYWLWKYRSWILLQAIERLSPAVARTIWQEELGLVGKMLHRDRRNFHAWDYRRHVVAQLEASRLGGTSMVEAEFAFTTKMINGDLSNFSAWHNRSKLIPHLLDERKADGDARKAFFDEGMTSLHKSAIMNFLLKLGGLPCDIELATVHEALNVGPEDQSLWYYHQYLIHAILGANGQGLIMRHLSAHDRKKYLEDEIDFIKDLLEDYLDVKWVYEALIECTLAANTLRTDEQQQASRSLVAGWLKRLRELDTKRSGRWDELEKQI
ncbi:hypothetical protein E4U21_001260 [Claviceps maximensis]|nr:hypothetical protein E4U21_001260 [Claviceps maximensis]